MPAQGRDPAQDITRTISAIVWRHANGAKSHAKSQLRLGPWSRAAQTYPAGPTWGGWERLLLLAQERRGVQLGDDVLDGTSIRADNKAAGAEKRGPTARQRDEREALGRSRGGYGTKACVIADGLGRAVAFILAPGQAHELPMRRLKEWRAVATRYEKTAQSFMGVLCLAATWLDEHPTCSA